MPPLYYLLIVCLSLFACKQRIGQPVEPFATTPLYITHQNYVGEELTNLWGKDGLPDYPNALSVNVGIRGGISPPLPNAANLGELVAALNDHPSTKLFVTLYFSEKVLGQLCAGELSEAFDEFAVNLRHHSGTVYLAVGLYPNNDLLPIEPEAFRTGYRCFIDRLDTAKVKNVSYGWYAFGLGPNYKQLPVRDWFPDKAYVNWIGMTASRAVPELLATSPRFSKSNHQELLELAKEQDLPVFVLDADPYGPATEGGWEGNALWQNWYEPTLSFIESNSRIRGYVHHSRYLKDSIINTNLRTHLLQAP